MSNKEILTGLIADVLDREVAEVGDLEGKNLFEDLGFDSVSIIELIVAIEDEFSIKLQEDELIDNVSAFDTLLVMIEKSLQ